jgi:hypothetical protein
MYTPDSLIPVTRLQLDRMSSMLVNAPKKDLFLRGPIPMDWLATAAKLPGKTLNVALALRWLHGLSGGEPFRLTQKALGLLCVTRETAGDCLIRLEQHGLIQVVRRAGRSPVVTILDTTKSRTDLSPKPME